MLFTKKYFVPALMGIPLVMGGILYLMDSERGVKKSSPTISIEKRAKEEVAPRESVPTTKITDSGLRGENDSKPSDWDDSNQWPRLQKEDEAAIRQQLNAYVDLNEVQLKTDSEKQKIAELYSDPRMLQSISTLLTSVPHSVDDSVRKLHQEAIEFLIEASKAESESANAVVLEILQNPLLENSAVPKEVRQLIAENQAELLYELVPTQKPIADFIRQQATPTQLKIYKNIHQVYQENLLASQSELKARH